MTTTPPRREKAVAFVVARLSSSRLPAKQFREIGGRPILRWITDALKRCRELDGIVIATAAEPANEPLREWAAAEGLPCFWYEGDVDHVTTRLRLAAEAFGADLCALVSGDSPLLHPEAVDTLISGLRTHPEADLVTAAPGPEGLWLGTEGLSCVGRLRAWQRGDELSDLPELKEHQFPVFGLHAERFRVVEVSLPDTLYGPRCRLSVDTWADLEFMNALHDELGARGRSFTLPEALALLTEMPSFTSINHHVHQRELREPVYRALFAVDAGMPYGYGHFGRSLELALHTVERLGWPVSFLVDDERAFAEVEAHGLQALWGSVGRAARESAHAGVSVERAAEDHELLVLDLWGGRSLPEGWKSRFAPRSPVAVLDRLDRWTDEAELVVVPGVTAPAADRNSSSRVLAGSEYVILRREILRASSEIKELDLLVYLHNVESRAAVVAYARAKGLTAETVTGFDSAFPKLLARAKVFVSSFGVSFYEALSLDTHPVSWPSTTADGRDAALFFAHFALAPAVVQSKDDLDRVIVQALNEPWHVPTIRDGTPGIVDRLRDLVLRSRGH